MEDDNREVDWAPKEIEKLSAAVTRLEQAVWSDSGDERITEAHRRISAETGRINVLRGQIEKLVRSNRVLERITALENGSRLVGTGNALDKLMTRLDSVEDVVEGMSHQGNADRDRVNQLTSQNVELERRVLQLEKAMASMSGDVIKAVWSEAVRELDKEKPLPNTELGNSMSQWNQGYSKGRESTLKAVAEAMKAAGCSLAQQYSVVRRLQNRM